MTRAATTLVAVTTLHLRELDLLEAAEQCREETERYEKKESYDPTFCIELFRRVHLPIESAAHEARVALLAQYLRDLPKSRKNPNSQGNQVVAWVRTAENSLRRTNRIDGPRISNDTALAVACDATDKFFKAYSFEHFLNAPRLSSILNFWQLCVYTTLADMFNVEADIRNFERSFVDLMPDQPKEEDDDQQWIESIFRLKDNTTEPEEETQRRDLARRVWERILKCCDNDDVKKRLVHLKYVEGKKRTDILSVIKDYDNLLRAIKRCLEHDAEFQRLKRDAGFGESEM